MKANNLEINKIDKPWGYYVDYFRNAEVVFKKIVIKPKEKLSYQYHNDRDEFWYVTKGRGVLLKDGIEKELIPTDYVLITSYENHTVECVSEEPLVIYEMQIGSPSEEDIVRIEDKYGRINEAT